MPLMRKLIQPTKASLAAFPFITFSVIISLSIFLISSCSGNGHIDFMQKGSGKSGSKFFTPDEDGIIMDEATGLMTMKDVISITFKSGTDEATMDNILSSINGKVVGYDKAVNYYQIRFPGNDFQATDKVRLKILGGYKEIEMASMIPVTAHKNPYYVK